MKSIATLGILAAIMTATYVLSSSTSSTDAGCTLSNARSCYDRVKSNSISILGKNASNTFEACTSNAAPNLMGTSTIKTNLCPSEQFAYSYCYEGKSQVYLRKFEGMCVPLPPPPPPPVPTPTTTPGTFIPGTFQVTSPNGGESLPFGAPFPIKWQGGNPSSTIAISIINSDRTQVKRLLVSPPDNVDNTGSADWITDLPLGNYVMYAQECADVQCGTLSAYDYGNASFQVVSGASLGKVNSPYITNRSLVILSPSGGESWQASTTHSIIWSGQAANAQISLSLINTTTNQTYMLIGTSTNSGIYNWNIPPSIPSGTYSIYTSCTTNCVQTWGWYAYSFTPFNITAAQ